MYRNQNYNGRGNYGFRPYNGNSAPYNSNYNGPMQQGYGNGQPKKHSGCKITVMKKGNNAGKQCITGWNASNRRGFLSFIATPTSNTRDVTSKNNREWQNWMVKITNKDTFHETITSGMYEVATGRLLMSDIGMVANPKTNYWGTMFKRKR